MEDITDKYWLEYFIYTFDNTSLGAGTGKAFTDVTVKMDTDAAFQLTKLSHVATNNKIYLNLRDETSGRFLNSSKVALNTISGDHASTGSIIFFRPHIVVKPLIINPATTYTVQVADYSNVANSLLLAFHGGKIRTGIPPWERDWSKVEYYTYVESDISLAANQTKTININTSTDSDFLLQRITGTFDREFFLTIKDTATDREWMNAPIHSNNIVGSGLYPNNMPYFRFIPYGAAIGITLQDLSGLSNNINLTFSGVKLYR